MRVKKYLTLLFAAILATTMLTGCPWDQEEDETDDASSVPVTSTDTSQDDDSNDSGNKDEEEKDPTPPEVTNNNSGQNGTVAIETPIYDKTSKTFSVTFTTEPTNDTHIASRVSVTGSTKDGGSFSGSWSAAGNMAAFARASAVEITPDDDHKKFTVTGIPANAEKCNISVTFEDLGYVIENGTYKVHSTEGLLAWNEAAQKDLSLSCTLTVDINLKGEGWTPIGNFYNAYAGTFDGGGYTISGLQVSGGDYVGLFGYVNGGTVENLNLAGVYISGLNFVGGVVGRNHGMNYNSIVKSCCFAGGSVTGTDSSAIVGGVVGNDYGGTITDCYWQKGPDLGVGSGGDGTTEVQDGNWSNVTLPEGFKLVDGKPVPSVIANRNSTPEVSGLTQRVLDTARLFGL